jgi:putative iron-regulated protein
MPDFKTNLLLGAGAIALTHTLTLWSGSLVPAAAAAPILMAAEEETGEGGEGGEGGGESGGVPSSYALASTDPAKWNYDATAVIDAYVTGAAAQYAAAAAGAATLQAAVDALLAAPSQATLDAARAAWVAARPAYLKTEVYRYYDGPIEQVEGRLNAWPMNEAYIDYTKDDPASGLINDPAFDVTAAAIVAKNQVSDEADVTSGWHAAEFLLWGQDLSADGPGNRPFADYSAGTPATDKRRAYLKATVDQIATDLTGLAAAWQAATPGSYAATFKAMPPREAIGRIVNGMAVMTGLELRSERLAVALDSGDQEDEQSCFSDTSKQDFVHDLDGIARVYYGRYEGGGGAGIDSLMKTLNPERAVKLDTLFADALRQINALGDPWDKVLASAPDSPERATAEAAVTALGALASELKASGTDLGVLVQIPGL